MSDLPDGDILDRAEAFAKAFSVPLRTAVGGVQAEAMLEDLASEHQRAHPELTLERAYQ